MQRGFAPIVILIGAVLIGVVAAGGGYYFQKQQTIKKINNFEQCSKAGYSVMESYPARCNTPDGRSFTQEISEEDKKKLKPPSGQVCIQVITPAKNSKTGECKDFPNPCVVSAGWEKVESCTASSVDTTNWKTYTQKQAGFSIQYPLDYSVREDNELIYSGIPAISLESNNGFTISIAVDSRIKNLSFDNPRAFFGIGPLIQYEKLPDNWEMKQVFLGGLKAFRVDHCCGGEQGIEVELKTIKGGVLYEIVVTPDEQYNSSFRTETQRKTMEHILSTFKFL